MKLTLEQIKEITFGALDVEERDGRFVFRRFTDEQARIFESVDRGSRVPATSSMMFDFRTDSKRLAFSYHTLPASSRRFCHFDVYIDDLLVYHEGEDDIDEIEDRAELDLGEGEKRVRVYFPCLFSAELYDVELDDGAGIVRTEKKYKALILGDSITQGYDAHFPSQCYANLMIEALSLDALNQGVGGEIFRAEHLGSTPLLEPDIITVAYGTNDWKATTTARVDREVPRYFAKLYELYPNAKIVYISPLWRGNHDLPTRTGDFFEHCDKLERFAREAGVYVISGRSLVPHMSDFFEDVVLHPNDLGFLLYGRSLITEIEKLGILE